jgi:two-component system response regulator AtoC
MASILIVEDELVLAHQLALALQSGGFEVQTAGTAAAGLEKAQELRPDLVLLDLRLPDRSGLELIGELKALDSSMLVVLMTAYGSVRDAVDAMRLGAADFLNKPIDVGELGMRIERLVRDQRRERELSYLRTRDRPGCVDVHCDDPKLRSIYSQVERLCDVHLSPGRRPPILLMGETGAGKGVVAQQIHEMLGGGPLVEVSCASLSRDRVESELFGVERRNGSGSRGSEPGLFEAAEGGTLVLDEIVELDIDLQGRFLRAIENRQIRRVGSARDRAVDVQILAITREEDLDACVAGGRLRPELLHRLGVLSFRIPPLRERLADVEMLASHFAGELGLRYRGAPRRLSADAIERLRGYHWPGNVRELRNVIERAILLYGSEDLEVASISPLLDAVAHWAPPGRVVLPAEGVRLEDVERDLLRQALLRTKGNQTRASALVGLSRDTLRYRIAKLGLEKERVPKHL